MTPARSRRVAAVVRLAKRLMPADGDLEGFLENLGRHRGRPIHLLPQSLGGRATSGLWIPGRHADFFVVDQPTTPSRRAAIVCHEAGHMLLEHRADASASAAVTAVAPDLSPALIARTLARHAYGTAEEAEAEAVGTVLGAEHARRQINASRLR